ncbi:winged helix-turn-helix transcriptional regulator [Rhodoplanes sp. TEM]|uniref:Winged helix-turn-helix transcriptional regulator n=1 Tax=Rhodoplanes tepidamans TaxID=200616 RepID=A0ABT5JER1_RHOTP|nr:MULTISPECIES: winged helix-turn-helix transcriptional regulator [Rhodoplanes]MDC7787988.1 winged helix-turn-helix transcriptional regulator [Rhodoplanes tepidamans]MDC7984828.1 winged helix-turn-helix transcriptional regulator [Rhodoplanes sp. TEM]MDQ0358417.1 putative DNA-binding protein (UPF0251 family) [Rhodoplanes tepidamans]
MTPLPDPPPEVMRLAEVIGVPAALALIEAFPGLRVYVPKAPTERIVSAIGTAAAAQLARAYGGEYLKVPSAKPWRVAIYRGRGLSYAEIARRTGLSEDGVWRILSRAEMTSPQLDLFER